MNNTKGIFKKYSLLKNFRSVEMTPNESYLMCVISNVKNFYRYDQNLIESILSKLNEISAQSPVREAAELMMGIKDINNVSAEGHDLWVWCMVWANRIEELEHKSRARKILQDPDR